MKLGEIGETESGFRSVSIFPGGKLRKFRGVEAASGREVSSRTAVLSGRTIDEAARIDEEALSSWLRCDKAGNIAVAEGVIVELPSKDESVFLCGPNGGSLQEVSLLKKFFSDELFMAALSQR